MAAPRRFLLVRRDDPTGVSGTGVVAEGVLWSDGSAALRWRTTTASTAVYASMRDVEKIHGHGGTTRVEWLDPAGVLSHPQDQQPLQPAATDTDWLSPRAR